MHIPGHLLDPTVCIGTAAVSAAAVGCSLHQMRKVDPAPILPLAGATAACLFAGQMLNYPVAGGTSGHLIGGVLAAVLLGPWVGLLVMSAVLAVQCLLFQDGGLDALGANILNMGVAGAWCGYAVFRFLQQKIGGRSGTVIAATAASFLAVLLGATLCSLELAAGGRVSPARALAAMLPAHAWIGAGEALISGAMAALALSLRPAQSASTASARPASAGRTASVGLAMALVLATAIAPWASSLPDGLDAALRQFGWAESLSAPQLAAPFADYTVPGWESFPAANAIAGVVGTLAAFALAMMLSYHRTPRPLPVER